MAQLTAVSQVAKRTLDILTGGLEPGESRKFDDGGAGIMAVCVERLSASTYSVAHYYEQNGDLLSDPDVVFWKSATGYYYPVSMQQPLVGYQEVMQLNDQGQPKSFSPRGQRSIAAFVTTWMRNIKDQQPSVRKAAKGRTNLEIEKTGT